MNAKHSTRDHQSNANSDMGRDDMTSATASSDMTGQNGKTGGDEARSMLGDVVQKVKDGAEGAKDAIVSQAGSGIAAVRDAAVEKADSARETLSDVGERLSATLQRASESGDGDALKSRMLSSVAEGLNSASNVLRQRSVADLTSDMTSLAKRHPGAFIVAAAVVGFATARFVRSSSERRLTQRQYDDYMRGPRA